ncbi:ankyrin [Plenodomus tracheiphilus IPT5]|uniref:Ankyrin n=1 Tax=Plenodomus tracheiphilus IPT5 TaxID=1408161 RepID=A0A6A7BF04_9PLEO|nr:ankyrin [Plenodomus tracheiphilus IPT5]
MPSYEEAYGIAPSTSTSTPANASTSVQPPNSSPSLPPAALDLAAKLFDLARAGTTPDLQQYVTAGIPPNLTNSTGDTLLMLASYHGHAETAQMLIDAGADVNVLNARGQSPIAGAVFKGWDEVVRVLYRAGANVEGGMPTAVDCARMFKRGSVLKLFGVEQGEESSVDAGRQC